MIQPNVAAMGIKAGTAPSEASGSIAQVLAWPFQHSNADAVAGAGFWLGSIGLALTLIGFVITFVQLKRTRSAAVRAREEAIRIQSSLRRYEVANETTRAAGALKSARNYIRSGLWIQAGDSYEDVLSSFRAMLSNVNSFSDDRMSELSSSCSYIERLCQRIEAGRLDNWIRIDESKTLAVARKHKLLIDEVTRDIERELIDVPD